MNRLKTFLLIIISVLISWIARGQNQALRVLDKQTGEPVPYAYVCLESLDKKVISNSMTDSSGRLNVVIDRISQVAVSCVGYISVVDTVDIMPEYTFYLTQTTHGLNEVIVTGQITPQRVDKSIYRVNVISGAQIGDKASQNLQELLLTELNFRSTQDNILGSGISIQGLSGENVKILIDGVPVVGRQNGIIDLSQINLSNVDHIEVVEGPMSVIYGSNALAGAVNIITRDDRKSKFTGDLNTYFETAGVYNGDASLLFRKGKSTLSLNGGRNFFGGFSIGESGRSPLWKPKEQYNGSAGYKLRSGNFDLGIRGVLFREELRSPGDLSPSFNYEKAFDEYHFTRRQELRAEGLWKPEEERGSFNILAAYSAYGKIKQTYLKDLVDLTKILVADPARHDTATIDALLFRGYYSSRPGRKVTFQTGYDINMETGTGKRMDGRKSIYEYAAFAGLRYDPAENFSVQPGIRLIYNTRYNAPLVYSLSLKWDPTKDLQLRTSAGRGFRSPSLKELYLDFRDSNHNVTGNDDLLAEKSFSLNGSAIWRLEAGKSIFTFNTSSYYNRMKNKIDLLYDPIDPTGARYMNIPGKNYVTKGGSFEIQYKLHPRFTLNTGINLTGKSSLADLSRFTWSENFTAGFNYKNLKYKFSLSLLYKYTGIYRDFRGEFDLNDQIGSITEVFMNDYNILDINISRAFLNEKVMLSTGAKNLFNITNVLARGGGSTVHGSDGSSESPVGWGRTFFIKAGYHFNKY